MLFNIHRILMTARGRQELKNVLFYIFDELPDPKIDHMINKVMEINAVINKTENLTREEIDDYEDFGIPCNHEKHLVIFDKLNALYLSEILSIFKNSEHEKQFKMSHEEFMEQKATKLSTIITETNPLIQFKKLLDVGCGDGQMTARVAEKLKADPIGIDLTGPAEDANMWSREAGIANLGKNIVYYDGVNLLSALKEKTEGFNQLFDVITLNHVLHHYPGRNAQIEGLQQVIALLKKDGVLLFSEHATHLNEEYFELIHVLFHLRPKVLNSKSTLDLYKVCEDGVDEYEKGKHQAHYFSEPLLIKLSEALGLKAIIGVEKFKTGTYDPSHTVITGFIKTTPTLTKEELNEFKPMSLKALMSKGIIKSLEVDDNTLGNKDTEINDVCLSDYMRRSQ